MSKLLPFRGKLDFRDLYRYKTLDVIKFYTKVAQDPKEYGVPPAYHAEFPKAVKLLENFSDPAAPLKVFTKQQGSIQVLDPKTFQYADNKITLYTVYDLLGYLLSVIGPAPVEATRENYYIPLLAAYSKQCSEFAGNIKRAPYMTQITYFDKLAEETPALLSIDVPDDLSKAPDLNTALGASIGGPPQIKRAVQEARYTFIQTYSGVTLPGPDVSLIDGIPKGQRFGHCAETYPLTLLLSGRKMDPGLVACFSGLALETEAVQDMSDYKLEALLEHMRNPCQNCQHLIKLYQGDPSKFMVK